MFGKEFWIEYVNFMIHGFSHVECVQINVESFKD